MASATLTANGTDLGVLNERKLMVFGEGQAIPYPSVQSPRPPDSLPPSVPAPEDKAPQTPYGSRDGAKKGLEDMMDRLDRPAYSTPQAQESSMEDTPTNEVLEKARKELAAAEKQTAEGSQSVEETARDDTSGTSKNRRRGLDPVRPLSLGRPTSLGNLAKIATDSIATDSVQSAGGGKLPVPDSIWVKRAEACKKNLVEDGLDPDFVLDPFNGHMSAVIKKVEVTFSSPKPYNLDTHVLDPYNPMVGFTNLNVMPWHIYGCTILVSGKTTKTDFQRKLHMDWIGVVEHTVKIVGKETSFADRVLFDILKAHVKDAGKNYRVFLTCTESKKLDNIRAGFILLWVNGLKDDAEERWAFLKTQNMLMEYRETIKFLGRRTRTRDVKEEEEDSDEFTLTQ